MYSIVAAAILCASIAAAEAVGTAHVINSCSYDVYLANTPSENGGYTDIDKTLSSGDSYSQQWTQLTNNNGWSLKLSKDTSFDNILQYEYTFHNDGIIWYDLSEVNGNPWDGNWEITASSPSSTCSPKQQAYRYATDDAYGMQACPQDSEITVTLCSGDSANDGGAASASSSVAAETSSLATASDVSTFSTPSEVPTSTQTPSSTEAPSTEASPTSATVPAYSGPHRSYSFVRQANVEAASTVSPTTFATSTTSTSVTTPAAGVTVTDIATAVVTEVVTAYNKRQERHAHHRRHGHN